jgi:hypothetical protein
VEGVLVYGDEISKDPETGLITVTGNPRAIRGADEIRAIRMTIDPAGDIVAEGNVVIIRNGQEIHTTRASYNLSSREGRAAAVAGQFGSYFMKAEEVLLRPDGTYEYRRVRLTTCDRPNPHYALYPRHVTVVPGQRLVASNVGIDFLNVRVLTIPKLARSLQRRDEGQSNRALYPQIGYDNFNGAFARKELTLSQNRRYRLDADLQINTFREPSGGLMVANPGKLQFTGSLFYRDIAENQQAPHLQVSRLPEVGVIYSGKQGAAPGRFLAHQVQGVTYPRYLDLSTGWYYSGQVSAGFFQQHHGNDSREGDDGNKSGGRLALQGQAVLPVVKLGPVKLNDLRLMARQNFYDTGEAFTVMGTGIGKRFRVGHFGFAVNRFDQFTLGKTPFLFDDVELRQEWRPAVSYRSKGFTFAYFARIRGDRGGLYDQGFSVSKLFHCIEPRLVYRVRRQSIGIEIRIPGLSGFQTTAPGQPRSVGTDEELELPRERVPPPGSGFEPVDEFGF